MTINTPQLETAETQPSGPKSVRRKGLAIGLTAGLLGGAAVGLVLGVPGLSNAADSGSQAAIVQQVDETDVESDASADHSERLREVLQPLVDMGAISAEQADVVTSHLVENRPEREGGHFEQRGGHRGGVSEAVLELLGTDAETLRAQIMDGSSLADIAGEAGVDVQQIVDAMLSEASDHLDEAVADGNLDESDAAERLAEMEERITDRVNGESDGEFPGRPGGFPGGSRGGFSGEFPGGFPGSAGD